MTCGGSSILEYPPDSAPPALRRGGAQGVLVNDTLRVNGAIAPEASLPYLFLSGGTTGLEMNTKFAAVTGLGDPGGFCELAVINQAPTGVARLFLSTQNNAPAGGRGELVALANGGVQLNALNQNIALNTTGGTANLVIEPNTGGASNGEVICFYGFQNLSDERLKTNVQPLSATEAQELFDGVEARSYDRVDGAAQQTGFVAQEVYKSGPLGKSFCKLKNFEDRELMTLDYQRMTAVLWQTCKSLQRRIEKLEKKKRGRKSAAEGPDQRLQADLVDFSQNAGPTRSTRLSRPEKGPGGPERRRLGRARGGDVTEVYNAAGERGDEAATFRVLRALQAPTNAARSFQPQYGAVRELAGYDLMTSATKALRPSRISSCTCRDERPQYHLRSYRCHLPAYESHARGRCLGCRPEHLVAVWQQEARLRADGPRDGEKPELIRLDFVLYFEWSLCVFELTSTSMRCPQREA
ncbi:hypothetical protein AK812_SmicGene29482 [Symbiodinium microadriaticum]|uniref:Peptidase S74 domain-containing protein n=1 Tax=Symbiodinium microadriaticum TaxID=2951 RepID=A0A1Q9D1T4_SYMMI|nr:hypothetical protein AK812_SmicGene29482 [Symbiodinium microadriaticum]